MKKWLMLFLTTLLLGLAACSEDDTTEKPAAPEPNNEVAPETEQPADTEAGEGESETNSPLSNEIENYIDGLVNWKSFELVNDLYKTSDVADSVDEEYHEQWQYVAEPMQMYISGQNIGFSNMHFEQYATADKAFVNSDMSEWQEVGLEEVDLSNPIDRRMEFLNIAVSSEGQVSTTDTEYAKTVDPAEMTTVMDALYQMLFSVGFDQDVELSAVEVVIQVNGEHITEIQVLANGTTNSGDSVEYEFKESYDKVNSITEIPDPTK